MMQKQIRNDPIETNWKSGSPDAHDHPSFVGTSSDNENPALVGFGPAASIRDSFPAFDPSMPG